MFCSCMFFSQEVSFVWKNCLVLWASGGGCGYISPARCTMKTVPSGIEMHPRWRLRVPHPDAGGSASVMIFILLLYQCPARDAVQPPPAQPFPQGCTSWTKGRVQFPTRSQGGVWPLPGRKLGWMGALNWKLLEWKRKGRVFEPQPKAVAQLQPNRRGIANVATLFLCFSEEMVPRWGWTHPSSYTRYGRKSDIQFQERCHNHKTQVCSKNR